MRTFLILALTAMFGLCGLILAAGPDRVMTLANAEVENAISQWSDEVSARSVRTPIKVPAGETRTYAMISGMSFGNSHGHCLSFPKWVHPTATDSSNMTFEVSVQSGYEGRRGDVISLDC